MGYGKSIYEEYDLPIGYQSLIDEYIKNRTIVVRDDVLYYLMEHTEYPILPRSRNPSRTVRGYKQCKQQITWYMRGLGTFNPEVSSDTIVRWRRIINVNLSVGVESEKVQV